MKRTAAMLALAAVFLVLPGCQILNTILQLAPTALMFLQVPEAVETVPLDTEIAALPLDEALELGLAAGASGKAWLVPIDEVPPSEATAPSRDEFRVCRLQVAETGIPRDLAERMAARGLTLVRVPAR